MNKEVGFILPPPFTPPKYASYSAKYASCGTPAGNKK
jgi:hypothetical protein